MPDPKFGLISDSARDARRYRNLLLALSSAIEAVQGMERNAPGIDLVLHRLLRDLAEALNAKHAFVALLREDQNLSEHWFELTAVWPTSDWIGRRLDASPVLDDLSSHGKVKVIDPLGDPSPRGIQGLELFDATSAVLARMQTASQTRIVGICNQRTSSFGPYLAADGMALDSIVELVALGARAGERRRRELDGIHETSAALLTVLDLQEALSIIVARAAQVFGVPATAIMLWDRMKTHLTIRDSWGLPLAYAQSHRLPGSLVADLAMADGQFPALTADALAARATGDEHLIEQLGLHEVLRAPMTLAGQLIGYLSIYDHDPQRAVTPEEIELTSIFASQAAQVVHRAELYEAIQRRSQHWQALHEASKTIAQGFAGDRKAMLDRIVSQAVERISGAHGPKANFGVIQLYDEAMMELSFESVYPSEALAALHRTVGERRAIGSTTEATTRIGITGRTVLTRQAQRIDCVSADPDYLVGFDASTQSEVAVPLLDGERVVGVLSLESSELAAFDEDDERALSGLAEMAVIVMKNQDQTEQLNRIHAVALMGAWSADVAHDTVREIGAIRRSVYLLNRQEGLAPQARERLMEVDKAAETLYSLQYLPDAPELATSIDGNKILLDDVVCREVEDLRRKYSDVQWRCEPDCAGLWVNMHEQWLRRALRHLARNAVAAMAGLRSQAPRRVAIRTVAGDGLAEVQVEDTGPGVDLAVIPLLFRQPVFHPDGSHGRGLLLVRFILEQHGGQVAYRWSRPGAGACFAFQLPVATADNPPAQAPKRAAQ